MAEAHPTRHERLTKTVVEAIEPPAAGHIIVWDEPRVGERRGFGIRVNAGGARTYFAQGRLPGGREVKLTIGRHGAPWTTEQARAKAKALLGAIAAGTDPTEAKEVGAQSRAGTTGRNRGPRASTAAGPIRRRALGRSDAAGRQALS